MQLLFCMQSLFSQVQISLTVQQNSSPVIDEWRNNPYAINFTVVNMNPDNEGKPYKIEAKLYKDDVLIAETDQSKMPVRNLPMSVETLYGEDIIPGNAIKFYGDLKETAIRTGMLPAGLYRACAKIIDLQGNNIGTPQEVCATVFITDYQPPELIYPINNQELISTNLQSTVFMWSPLTPIPSPAAGLKYHVMVTEVLDGQTPEIAFDVNQPIIDQEVDNISQFRWPVEISVPDENKNYVWSVKPLNYEDKPYIRESNHFSKVGTFRVLKQNIIAEGGDEDEVEDEQQPNDTVSLDFIYAGKNREFKIRVVEAYTNDKKQYKGIGLLHFDYIKSDVIVEFSGISLNKENELIEGFISSKPSENGVQFPVLDVVKNYTSATVNSYYGEFRNKVKTYVDKSQGAVDSAVDGIKDQANQQLTNASAAIQSAIGMGISPLDIYASSQVTTQTEKLKQKLQVSDKIMNHLDNNAQKVFNLAGVPQQNIPIQFPIGFQKSGATVALSQFFITKEGGIITLLGTVKKPASWDLKNENFGFLTHSIKFSPSNIEWENDIKLDLVADISNMTTMEEYYTGETVINMGADKLEMRVVAPKKGKEKGSYLVFNQNEGIKDFRLQVQFNISKWLYYSEYGDNLAGVVDLVAKGNKPENGSIFDNIIFEGTMPERLTLDLVESNDYISLKADKIYYDASDTSNPPGMAFPENYEGEKSELFRGFYAKNITISLPQAIKSANLSDDVMVNAENMILNGDGITLKVAARNVISFPQARISKFYASVDEINFSLINSSFTDANVKGRLVLPLSNVTEANTLNYIGSFSKEKLPYNTYNNFEFSIQSDKDINWDIWKLKAYLKPTSKILAYYKRGYHGFNISLDAGVGFDSHNKTLSLARLDVEGLGLEYDSAPSKGFKLSSGAWKFAGKTLLQNKSFSADNYEHTRDFYREDMLLAKGGPNSNQEHFYGYPNTTATESAGGLFSGFPINVKNIKFKPQKGTGNNLVNLALKFDVNINIAKEMFKAETGLTISGGLKKDYTPFYKDIDVDRVMVGSNNSFFDFNGELRFNKNDAVYGDGFMGNFEVRFKSFGEFGVDSNLYFGSKKYSTREETFRYWKVDADFYSKTGIPLGGAVKLVSIGGGAYSNMKPIKKSEGSIVKFNFVPEEPRGGIYKYGFRASVGLGITDPHAIYMGGIISGVANKKTLHELNIKGIAKLFTDDFTPIEREAAIIGTLNFKYQNNQQRKSIQANVQVKKGDVKAGNVNLFTVTGEIKINANLTNRNYLVAIGSPNRPITVGPYYGYLIFGNRLGRDYPGLGSFTRKFKDSYNAALWNFGGGSMSNKLSRNSNLGRIYNGIGLGLGTAYNLEFDKSLDLWITELYLKAKFSGALEANLALLKRSSSSCGFKGGYQGIGSAGGFLHADVKLGVKGSVFGFGSYDYNIGLGAFIGAKLEGGMPDPLYFKGNFDICGRVWKYSACFSSSFDYKGRGTKSPDYASECVRRPSDPQLREVQDKMGYNLVKSVHLGDLFGNLCQEITLRRTKGKSFNLDNLSDYCNIDDRSKVKSLNYLDRYFWVKNAPAVWVLDKTGGTSKYINYYVDHIQGYNKNTFMALWDIRRDKGELLPKKKLKSQRYQKPYTLYRVGKAPWHFKHDNVYELFIKAQMYKKEYGRSKEKVYSREGKPYAMTYRYAFAGAGKGRYWLGTSERLKEELLNQLNILRISNSNYWGLMRAIGNSPNFGGKYSELKYNNLRSYTNEISRNITKTNRGANFYFELMCLKYSEYELKKWANNYAYYRNDIRRFNDCFMSSKNRLLELANRMLNKIYVPPYYYDYYENENYAVTDDFDRFIYKSNFVREIIKFLPYNNINY